MNKIDKLLAKLVKKIKLILPKSGIIFKRGGEASK